MKRLSPRRRRYEAVRRDGCTAEADGRDQGNLADPVAHPQDLCALRARDFLIALGYKGEYIKRYMAEYASLSTNMTVDLAGEGRGPRVDGEVEDWRVALIDTGRHTETGGRLLKLVPYLDGETFMITFGDGVSDVNVGALMEFHRAHGKLATLTAVRPPRALGTSSSSETEWPNFRRSLSSGRAASTAASWSLSRAFSPTSTARTRTFSASRWSGSPPRQLMAYKRTTFWQCTDTLRDKILLQQLWDSDDAPWKVW